MSLSKPAVLSKSPVSIREIVDHVLPLLIPQANIENVKVITNIAEDLPPVSGDASRLEHLVINLCLNANFAMTSTSGTLTITAISQDKGTKISFSDSGHGIDAKHLPNLDDRYILNALQKLFSTNGFQCTTAMNGQDAWNAVNSEEFDLVILYVGLPDQDGVSLCRRIRTKHRMPIIMVTARDGASDKVIALEVGADDYICKPFDPQEALARVRAHLRRHQEYNREDLSVETYDFKDFIVNADARDVIKNGKAVQLTEREFELTYLLAKNSGRTLSKEWLFEEIWGYDAELGIKTLAVFVRRVRCKIENDPDSPEHLQTVRVYGYKLV